MTKLSPGTLRQLIRSILAAALLYLAQIAVFYIAFDGTTCFSRALFGPPCPGCGLTRAGILLLQGDIRGSLHFHPLLAVLPVFFGALTLHLVTGIRSRIVSLIFIVTPVLFLLAYFIRMYLYFPHTPPMDFNDDAIIFRLLRP